MSAAGISQMFFSQDISRYLGHAFPAILYSLDLIARRKILGSRLAEVLVILVLCNLLVPQYYVGQRDTSASLPWVLTYFFKVTGLNP
jgi:hypothetical protein